MTDYSTATIDTGNALAGRLVRAVGAGRLQDIVSGATLTTEGTVTSTEDGFTFGANSSIVLPDTPLPEFTIFAWAFGAPSGCCLVSRSAGAADAYINNYALRLISGVQVRGDFKEDGTSLFPNTFGPDSGTNGVLMTAAFSYDGTTMRAWRNGVGGESGALGDPWTSTSTGMVTQIGAVDGTARETSYSGNGIQLVLIFDGALTDAEQASLHANPDQVFSLTADTTAPTLTGVITEVSKTTTSISISWPAGADNIAVTSYEVSSNAGGAYTDVGNVLAHTFTGLTASTAYDLRVRAKDAAGNVSTPALALSVTTLAPDTTLPTMNGAITVGTKTPNSISISYIAASDNVGVTGYEVSSNGGSTWSDNGTALSYTFLGLSPITSYSLRVRAYDGAGNRAATPLAATVTTYRDGATGQFIIDNTGPVGANPAGILYNDVVLPGDADKWFSFDIVTPVTDTASLDLYADGSFIWTGLSADSFTYQLEVDGVDYDSTGNPGTEAQLVLLDPADGSQTLAMPLLTNTSILYAPEVVDMSFPLDVEVPLLTNTSVLFSPRVVPYVAPVPAEGGASRLAMSIRIGL